MSLQFCLCVVIILQFSLKENSSLGKDSNVTLEIPVGTTLAYVLTELEIQHDGHFGEKPTCMAFTPLQAGTAFHLHT